MTANYGASVHIPGDWGRSGSVSVTDAAPFPICNGREAVTGYGTTSDTDPDSPPDVTCKDCRQLIAGDLYAFANNFTPWWGLVLCAACAHKRYPWYHERPHVTICRRCGRRRHRNRGWGTSRAYCCDACAHAADLKRRRSRRRTWHPKQTCATCGAAFTPTRSDARYCSPACRQRAYRQRKQDAT
jgi:hypothetical protein